MLASPLLFASPLLLASPPCAQLRGCAAVTPRSHLARMSAETPSVSLLSFRPALPPVDPTQTPKLRALRAQPSAPAWVDGVGLAFFAGGRLCVWDAQLDAVAELPSNGAAPPAASQTAIGAATLLTCAAAGLAAVDALSGGVVALPLEGAAAIASPTAAAPLSDEKVLVASGPSGAVVCLGAAAPPVRLYEGVGGSVRSMCTSDGEKALWLAVDGAVLRAELRLGLQAAPPVQVLPPSTGAVALATDRQGNLYACTRDGVRVFDEEGDEILLISLPAPPSGCCFGGAGLSTLLVTAADGIWSVSTRVQGVAPPTEAFRRKMDKYVSAGDFRHDGW